jgi:hypothetical protein
MSAVLARADQAHLQAAGEAGLPSIPPSIALADVPAWTPDRP